MIRNLDYAPIAKEYADFGLDIFDGFAVEPPRNTTNNPVQK